MVYRSNFKSWNGPEVKTLMKVPHIRHRFLQIEILVICIVIIQYEFRSSLFKTST